MQFSHPFNSHLTLPLLISLVTFVEQLVCNIGSFYYYSESLPSEAARNY